ncbi:hypothetical protein WHR41_02190 [Cladosporium halotolerans]|uniref:Alpha-1,2-galactosyltransferase n=1 Tax=Cladosporium halotolerans TaxID=1052096 RepID=A0AB34KW43_9PEZI
MMQFPYPRKTSQPQAYTSARASTLHRRRSLRNLLPYLLSGLALFVFIIYLFRPSSPTPPDRNPPPGTSKVVIVTPIDPSLSPSHANDIKENRRDYAQRHGYETFFPSTEDYDLMPNVPSTWATVPALRHALTLHPHTQWLFYLTPTALIMNTREPLSDKVLTPSKLESLMIVDKPVVPPDSVIKTFSHLKGERVDFVLAQDHDGLAGGSLLIRNTDWAKFFLDAWFDPLYRSYNFQKAEGHALEHIVQWHGTVLAKLALVPQRVLNSYTRDTGSSGEGIYQEGDFVANFHGCARDAARNCEEEMKPLMSRWRELRDGQRG